MKFIDDIKNFIPFNAQEEKDKEFALKYINIFPDILYRENEIAHLSASSWIVNKDRTKILMVYHKIYDSWGWTGGHADGDSNLLNVAIKEAKEETGLIDIKPISTDIFSIENLCVDGHIKKGKYVSAHLHINVTYLLEANDTDPLIVNKEETKGVKWVLLEESLNAPSEKWMVENIYRKLNEKLKKLFFN